MLKLLLAKRSVGRRSCSLSCISICLIAVVIWELVWGHCFLASLYLFASVFWFQALWGQDCLFSMTVPTTATSSLGVVQFCSSRNVADPIPCSRCLFRLPLPSYLHVLHVCNFLVSMGVLGRNVHAKETWGRILFSGHKRGELAFAVVQHSQRRTQKGALNECISKHLCELFTVYSCCRQQLVRSF